MLVSIIVPCYNVEEYISECLNSALSQTYDEIEIICVDDGSTDKTLSILSGYEKQSARRITVIAQQQNRGASAARNLGLAQARGEWIQFLDADDLLLPDKIQHQVTLIEKAEGKPDFVAGNEYWQRVYGETIIWHQFTYNNWLDLIQRTLGDTTSNLWNAESLRKVGGWNEQLRSSQEVDLMFRLLKSGAKVLYDPKPSTIKRERKAGSISTQDEAGNVLRRLGITVDIRDHLVRERVLDDTLSIAVQKQLFSTIREVFAFDQHLAINLLSDNISRNFLLSSRCGRSWVYRLVFFVFGFRITEGLVRLLWRVRKRRKAKRLSI